ncbi:Rv1733c family protein [Pseudonocardia acaciae]|uniref:Rv1733c family protein n=1 Tax=Pseudonocardia acaciae TaxID=551276 RepID=UPI00048F25E6|nr:hypothetical protein [Pseudonocardia acaciae]
MADDQRHGGRAGDRLPRRPTDRVESIAAWLLALLGLLGGIVAFVIGSQTHASTLQRARAEAAARTPVTAVVVSNTPPMTAVASRGGSQSTRIPVRWVGSDGVERVDEAVVTRALRAGDPVTVWADRDRHLVPPPTDPDLALVGAVVTAGLAALGVGVTLGALWWVVRRGTLARNSARWAREWRGVEPVWSGRALGESPSS